jgi:hypothetical protein
MTAVPPTGQSWVQTTTLEGNHDWDTWLMEGATGYDTEFVVAGEPFPFTIFGYVPGLTSTYQATATYPTYWQLPAHSFVPGGTGTVSGIVSAAKVYVPAQGGTCLPGTIWGGLCGARIDGPIADGWVALSDLGRGDTAVKLVRASANGSFTITGVPAGTYTLTYWDEKQNHILDLVQVVVAADGALDHTVHVGVAAEALAAEAVHHRPAVDPLVPVRAAAGHVGSAQRVAEDVGVDLAKVVGELAGEARQAVLARVVLAVGRRHVGEDLRGRGGRRQRERLERDLDEARVRGNAERRAVQLVSVREHGDEVAAVGEGDPRGAIQRGLVALGHDRRGAPQAGNGRPGA